MSFSGLHLLQQEAKQLHERRKADLEPMLQKGLALLNEAESNGFSDRLPLKKASQIFLKVLITHRSDIRPYLFLAYVFMLLKNFNRAEKYLLHAEQIQPEHDLFKKFQAAFITLKKQSETHQPSLVFQTQGTSDALFNELKQEVINQVRALTELIMPVLPLHKDEGVGYQNQVAQFEANFALITEHLRKLDQEMDTLELRVHLRPFEILMRRHKAHLDVLMEYQSIKDELLDFKQQVTWACTRLEANGAEASLDPFEQILEDILDQCDLLADRIDDFEKQGQATPSLEEIYHQILPVIERYQEQMDQV